MVICSFGRALSPEPSSEVRTEPEPQIYDNCNGCIDSSKERVS